MIEVILGLNTTVIVFLIWKAINHERSRSKMFEKLQEMFRVLEINSFDIVRIKRIFNTAQSQAFMNTICSGCGDLLPENTARTHDGLWLCTTCKTKAAE